MTIDDAKRQYRSLSMEAQLRFLASFGHSLTIAARDAYDPGAPGGVWDPERLRAINEIQHRILGHIHALLLKSEQRYPDDVLVSIMLGSDDQRIHPDALWAFKDALKNCQAAPDR